MSKNTKINLNLFAKIRKENRLNDEQAAKFFNCSISAIRNYRKKLGLSTNRGITLLNKKFNKLMVVSEYGRNKYDQILWECICECGNTTIVNGRYLRNGEVKSCGCLRHRSGDDSCTWKGYKELSGTKWHILMSGAKNRKIDVNITKQFLYNLLKKQNYKCGLSGRVIDHITGSVDRIDSNKSYSEDNVWWLDKDIHAMKWEYNLDKFLDLCFLVSHKQEVINTEIKIYSHHALWKGYGNIGMHQWGRIMRTGKSVNHIFDISIKHAWNIYINQNGRCALTGVPIYFQYGKNSSTASLDRINSDEGYINGNIWWLHKNINKMKFTFSVDYFKEMCNLVVNYNEHQLNKTGIMKYMNIEEPRIKVLGIVADGNKWIASIRKNGIINRLGSFDTKKEAEYARMKAEINV